MLGIQWMDNYNSNNSCNTMVMIARFIFSMDVSNKILKWMGIWCPFIVAVAVAVAVVVVVVVAVDGAVTV